MLTALVPALIVLPLTLLVANWLGFERLRNRIWVGTWVGWGATAVLDIVRLTGFNLGFMPGNMPRMFGTLILDTMAMGPSLQSDLVGYAYHFVVGASFGLTYTLLVGRAPWWGGLLWGLLIEVGMMTTPPMVVAMDTGIFAWKMPGTLVVSLMAHVAFGIVLGLTCARHIRYGGHLLDMARQAFMVVGSDRHAELFGQQGTIHSPSGSLKHPGNRIE